MDNNILDSIRKMPKVELHLHLEGAIRYNTVLELAAHSNSKSDIDITTIKRIKSYEDLSHFIKTMKAIGDFCLRNADDYERVAYELFCDLDDRNIIYAEVSYDPTRGLRVGIPWEDIMAAMLSAKERAESERKIRIGLIIGLGREHGIKIVSEFIDRAIKYKDKYQIVGIDLHGNESAASPSLFKEAYKKAEAAGLGLRAHAGEGCKYEFIWDAVKDLHVSRIGHGVGAINDEKLMDYLIANNIVLDICPTSNYMLGIIKDYSEHPLKTFYKKGIKFSISTDDPLYFNTSLDIELYLLHQHFDFSVDDIKKINLFAVEGAFATKELKDKLYKQIEEYNK